mmetsp:Transcript_23048/g.75063  ORF Transcript_23048/g.75063 Transcript_23048/m.75063 type:complete len:145 (-) Transcript_23048:820-1254(-)
MVQRCKKCYLSFQLYYFFASFLAYEYDLLYYEELSRIKVHAQVNPSKRTKPDQIPTLPTDNRSNLSNFALRQFFKFFQEHFWFIFYEWNDFIMHSMLIIRFVIFTPWSSFLPSGHFNRLLFRFRRLKQHTFFMCLQCTDTFDTV